MPGTAVADACPSCECESDTGAQDDRDARSSALRDVLVPETLLPDSVVIGGEDPGSEAGDEDVALDPDVMPDPGTFGAPCVDNDDCDSRWCVEGPSGFVCTMICVEECPRGYSCKGVSSAGGADVFFLCMPNMQRLCTPCALDIQCAGGACLELDGEGQCSAPCAGDSDCPPGYACSPAPDEHEGDWCLPVTGSCSCTEEMHGALRTCSIKNDVGECFGIETCKAQDEEETLGWVDCSASEPVEEVCDGVDNDCDGLLDDGVEGAPCANENEHGSCAGVGVCLGTQGFVCQAPTPAAEICDLLDNDCNDETDEPFKDEEGRYTQDERCGTCGNDCDGKIANGTGKCGLYDGLPVCMVEQCEEDFILLNDFQCAVAVNAGCKPCVTDEDCFGGECTELDGQRVCVTECGSEGGACPEGFGCADAGAGLMRCLPSGGSCTCTSIADGLTRMCTAGNSLGTCVGVETCVAEVGWTGCTAPEPVVEDCNGRDDDCNGLTDDALSPPEAPCEQRNVQRARAHGGGLRR